VVENAQMLMIMGKINKAAAYCQAQKLRMQCKRERLAAAQAAIRADAAKAKKKK